MKALLSRRFSWLVIVAFTFQTIWPSWVMASETETVPPFTSLRSFSPRPPSFNLQTFIDEGAGGNDFTFSTKHSLTIPKYGSVERTQYFLNQSLDVKVFYPNLKITEAGFSWSQYGFNFLLDSKEQHLFVSADSSKGLSISSKLRIYNPKGNIILGEGLDLEHLLLKGQSVFHIGSRSKIDQMDIWATGNAKESKVGAFQNSEQASLSTSKVTIHGGNVKNCGHWSIAEVLDLNGHNFANHSDLFFDPGAALVNSHSVKNFGRFSGTDYSFASRLFQNRGKITGNAVRIGVEQYFSNLLEIKAETYLHIWGAGVFEHRGTVLFAPKISTDNALFESLVDWQYGRMEVEVGEQTSWKNGKDVTAKFKSLKFTKSAIEAINDSTIEAETLINHRDVYRNRGTMSLGHWEQSGSKFINEKGANVEISGSTITDTDLVDNQGNITFGDVIRGRIGGLKNQGGGLIFKSNAFLTGSHILNTKFFKADGIFEWLGETIDNQGNMFLFDNRIHAITQIINRKLFLWTHNAFRTGHFLNLGWTELTGVFDEDASRILSACADQSTAVKTNTFENRGVCKRSPMEYQFVKENESDVKPKRVLVEYQPRTDIQSDVDFQHWLNSGRIDTQDLQLQAKMFKNTGSLIIHRRVWGVVDKFENLNKMDVLGSLSLIGQAFTNFGTMTIKEKAIYKGKSFLTNKDSTLTAENPFILDLALEELKIYGAWKALKGFTVNALTIENFGKIETAEGMTTLSGYFLNLGFADIADLTLDKYILKNSEGQLHIRKLTGPKSQKLWIRNIGKNESANTIEAKTRLIIQGGFEADCVENSGEMSLDNGHYIVDVLSNSGGIAEIDKLTLLNLNSTLFGQILIKEYIHRNRFHSFRNYGIAKILKGILRADEFSNNLDSHISLGKGSYSFGTFQNFSIITALSGMVIEADILQNDGTVQSETNLRVLALDATEKPQSPNDADTPLLKVTKLTDIRAATRGNYIFGILKAGNDLIIELAKYTDLAQALYLFGKNWQCNGQLSLYSHYFLQTVDIELSRNVFMKVKVFDSTARLSLSKFKHVSESFRLGFNNDQMGIIETVATKEEKEAAEKEGKKIVGHELEITVEQDADMRFGKIFGQGKTSVYSEEGQIFVGDKARKTAIDNSYHHPANSSIVPCYYEQEVSNGSYVSSNDKLSLFAPSGAITLAYGNIHSQERLNLTARDFVANISGRISSRQHLTITAENYMHKRSNTILTLSPLPGYVKGRIL